MLIDGRTLPQQHTLDTDICIVGAGAAGITLATALAGQPVRVLLVESGGLELDAATQALYRGSSVGLRYFPLEAVRLRYFGGTTNHWGGVCRPFTEFDFAPRDWIPHSGWPLARATVAPYYERAARLLDLRPDGWTSDAWTDPDRPPLPLAPTRVVPAVLQNATHQGQRFRFGQVFRDTIREAANVTACLHASALRLDTDAGGRTVSRAHFATLAGNRFSVRARHYVLAAGAVENARLLLLSNHQRPAGLGNDHDVVGRFFLEHPQVVVAAFRPAGAGVRLGFYRRRRVGGVSVNATQELSEDLRRRERLINVWLDFLSVDEVRRLAGFWRRVSLRYLFGRLREGAAPDDLGRHLANVTADLGDRVVGRNGSPTADEPLDEVRVTAVFDPAPNPDSRVTLGTELDALGQRRVTLDWRLSAIDRYSVRRTVALYAMEIGRAGLGHLQLKLDDRDTAWPDDLVGSGHQIGTTRMSDDRTRGVVDRDCRVHDTANLFVAGASVFPTAGAGSPTLLIVALALRLADHLRSRLR